jgi:integrase/recombinase XerD
MARNRKAKPQPMPRNRMGSLIEEFIAWMRVRNTAEYTQHNRRACVAQFVRWANERGIEDPMEVTRPVLESYQRYLYYYRQKNGKPLTFRTQYARLVPVRTWFRWLVRNNHILHNPASDLDMPKLEKRLPRAVLNEEEAERLMIQPDVRDPLGMRDRAILETFYSTGIRRMELVNLKLFHVDHLRGTLSVWLGKGKKDRVVPIGERALAWVDKYLREARPQLVMEPDEGTIFLSIEGGPFHLDRMSKLVRDYVEQANLGKCGACHMLRHTMATLMLENGADIRFIQEMLGHSELQSTQIYTQVSIRQLKKIHSATHPGAMLEKKKPASTDAMTQDEESLRANLFATLDAEAEEDGEEPKSE